MPCTARSAYPSRATDISQEQMPHVQQRSAYPSRTTDISQNRCHIATDTPHKNRCYMYSKGLLILLKLLIFTRTDATCTADLLILQELLISHIRTDATCTARSAYPSEATDISQEQMPCTARSAYPSRATDISQEQMPHCTARSFPSELLIHTRTDATCTARSAYLQELLISHKNRCHMYSKICGLSF
ncbi:unnamed protein product [Mytilus edulis]|uniref:Uncharacterized protein n=1 Tax=Mytilus edulis TaxID=6550 RepID=A0A8S3Q8A7_MYTED|nr:unnamed protein product [Mytilus edulis]